MRRAMIKSGTNKKFSIGFIGCGRIGKAIVRYLLDSGKIDPKCICIGARRPDMYREFVHQGVVCTEDLSVVVKTRIIFVCCLPSHALDVSAPVRGLLRKTSLLVSIMAGISTTKIQQMFGTQPQQNLTTAVHIDAISKQASTWAGDAKMAGAKNASSLIACKLLADRPDVLVTLARALGYILKRLGSGDKSHRIAVGAILGGALEAKVEKMLARVHEMEEELEELKERASVDRIRYRRKVKKKEAQLHEQNEEVVRVSNSMKLNIPLKGPTDDAGR